MKRRNERGSAMLVTLIIIAALLGGAAVLVSLQLASGRSSDLTRSGMSSLYCAEAGLAAARPVVMGAYGQWNSSLLSSAPATNLPAGAGLVPATVAQEIDWLETGIGSHDVDGDTVDDFVVYLVDNDDEQTPLASDLSKDNDMQVFVVSTCIRPRDQDTPRQLRELLQFNGVAADITGQIGGGALGEGDQAR